MMKSFFKKLAFVMALAMVVTLAAPAGSAFAASALRVVDADKNVCTTYELAVGETEDFAFWDAKNWTNYTWAWESSDPEVASVNKGGVVEGLKDGVATITVTGSLDGEVVYSGEVVVTVGKGVDTVNEYTVRQVNHNKVELTFERSIEYTEADIEVYRVFDGIETYWPIQNVKVNGNILTYETYVNYEDAEQYVVYVAGDEGTEYTTSIGDVVRVGIEFGSVKDAEDDIVYPGKAYTNGEDGEELIVYLTPTLYNKYGVNVTDYYTASDIVYELTEENENVMIDNYAGELVFYKVGVPVRVQATYTYYDEEGEQHSIPSAVTPIVSEKAPAYGIKKIDAWTIVADGTPWYWVNWSNSEIKAEDETRGNGYHIVVKFTDSYGNQYVTDPLYADPAAHLYYAYPGEYNSNLKTQLDTGVITQDQYNSAYMNYESIFEENGNWLTFSSSNTNKLLVGSDGSLTTNQKTSVAVILTLHNSNSEREDYFVRNVSAFKVNVADKRKVSKVVIENPSVTVITDALETPFETKTTKVYLYDQYNEKWYGDVSMSIQANVEGSPAVTLTDYVASDGSKVAYITVNGANFAGTTKQTVYYTIKELEKGNTTTLKVLVKNPKIDTTAATAGAIKVTSYDLAVGNRDMAVADWDGKSSFKYTDIHYYELSNGCEVGHKDTVTLIASAGALKIAEGTASIGTQYVVVYDKNGNVVPVGDASVAASTLATNNPYAVVEELQKGEYRVHLAVPVDGVVKYAPTGDYTVKVLEIRSFSKGFATFKTKYDEKFSVTNTNATVSLRKQENVSLEIDVENPTNFAASVAAAKKTIVRAAFSFNKGGQYWAIDDSNIASVRYKINGNDNSIIITKVTFNIPTGNDDGDVYQYTLTLNKSVELTFK